MVNRVTTNKTYFYLTPEEIQRSSIYGSFWLGGNEFALPVCAIQEVVNEPEKYSQVPMAPDHLAVLFELREKIIPIIDLRILLEYPAREKETPRKVAIIEHGDLAVGLLLDETGGVIYEKKEASRVNFETNRDDKLDVVIDGILKMDDGRRMIQVLDPYRLLSLKQNPRIAKKRPKKLLINIWENG